VLEQEPGRAGSKRCEDVLVEVVGGQDQHPRGGRWIQRHELGGRLHPVEVGHANVHQRHVRPEPANLGDGFAAVSCLADDLEVRLGFENQLTGLKTEAVGAIAAAESIVLHELSTRTSTLEDVFLDLTNEVAQP
jgi:hypothetical protein